VLPTETEMKIINALHEAWHCAAALEKHQPVTRVDIWPNPGTIWGDRVNHPDGFIFAVITLASNIAMPQWPSEIDRWLLAEFSTPEEVERARPEADRLVGEVIDRSGVAAIARQTLASGSLSGGTATRLYRDAKRTEPP
jgi:hypothetical protein